MMYQCISIISAKPEARETIITAAKKLLEISRQQPGNLYYNLLQSSDNPDKLVLIEKWESREAFLGHVAAADQPGDPVYTFGCIAEANSTEPSVILNCEVLA